MKVIRKLLAITLLIALVCGVYVAIKGFSGYDPLKIDTKKVVGLFTIRGLAVLSDTGIKGLPVPPVQSKRIAADANRNKTILSRYGLVADSHNASPYLRLALAQMSQNQVSFVVGLGDYTDVGTVKELQEAKKQFDEATVPYYTIPGDHDFWDNKNKGERATSNFEFVFGNPYQYFIKDGVTHVLVNNANLDSGLTEEQFTWLEASLETANIRGDKKLPVFVYLHQPLYHPTTSHVMGRINDNLSSQRDRLLGLFQKYQVDQIISGDIHFFSQYAEPKTQLAMTTVGAVTNDRNPQKPRFAIVTVYTDGSFTIDDLQIQP